MNIVDKLANRQNWRLRPLYVMFRRLGYYADGGIIAHFRALLCLPHMCIYIQRN